MIRCYEQNEDNQWVLSDFYSYDSLEDMFDDFGEENVAKVCKGVFACRGDDRDDDRDDRDTTLVVVDTKKPVDVNTLMAKWEWSDD